MLIDLFGGGRSDAAFKRAKEGNNLSWLYAENVERAEFLESLGLGPNALFTSRSQGKRWIDQTPQYTLMADVLADMFPGAFFLHILRDGHRVVNSMVNISSRLSDDERTRLHLPPWATDFNEACKAWRQFVEASMSFSATYPTRCLTVVHEELVANTEKGFDEIFRFIGVPYEEAPANFLRFNRINSSFGDSRGVAVQERPDPWNEWSGLS